ncbi:MAG TPA: hypothetical protein VK545_21365 [Streptomyces sp.]|nr:hypothetical protein [Streptomyces sp.]
MQKPYPLDKLWTFRSRASGHVFTEQLCLYWEVNGSSITDD